jgi:hypothetical protein
MKSVIQFINKSNSNRIIEVLKKYLIITCVSLIDEVLTRLARRTIEEKNIRISAFKSQISKQFSQNQGTVGEIVAASFNLSKPEGIDSLFSSILRSDVRFRSLDMSFLRAVQKFDWYDPFREFRELRTKHLYKNWKDFMRLLEIRNETIHGMANVSLSKTRVFSFCDNTLSFLEAAIAICFMDDDTLRVLRSHEQIKRAGLW